MRPSSPSNAHSTQVPIKVQHKIAKKGIRRRRVDLQCGCSYFISINCHNHGFTHRGTHHCSSSTEWRVYLGDSKSPLFQDNRTPQQAISNEPRHHFNSDKIQPQYQEGIGDSQMFSQLPNLDDITASDWSFLKSI
ncbi:transcription activator protein [Tomato leaf curl Barka virus]|uniref:Transcriptional activator protein n=1 Tax=Tomato leaf curl Oman virus TaxID=713949 RepID=A0A140KKJ9_9GEMI|nr:transcription activator protein [Tomato leaf curl Barka virus]CDO50041.1 transcriptional activation protein [Tomato leaf curl Oman virus]AHZ45486.1 transcription activator protein [Tomato leaf curl Barka virus]AHZ45492.1 transcription activator protein [Tomato leaf curl Barka virus]QGN65525.1 transreplication associated protein [Tomato leaf curl Barka virus]QGN65531.1 transreplication associated protein [Tomato leaf curl Barka virus]